MCLVRFCYRVGTGTAAAPPLYVDGTTHVYFDHLCNAVQITSMLDSLFLVYKYLRLLDHGSQLQLSDHVKM